MIPRLHKRGQSFKGACGYILHDAQKTSRDRVLWSATQNLVSRAEDAWFEMFATARDQAALKQQSGQDARGRKNTKPVLHVSLSWAITDNPTSEHMLETARAALNAMGLADHQAVIAAHGDKQHLHVHMVVNTIHPETGMTAPLKYTKERLSRWAEGYERAHGIHCEQRVENNRLRDDAIKARQANGVLMIGDLSKLGQPDAGVESVPYVPVKYKGPSRSDWFTLKDLKDRMKRMRAEMDLSLRVERTALRERHDRDFKALGRDTYAAIDQARAAVAKTFKPQWRDLYRTQKRELRHVAGAATLFERAVFVFGQRERLGRGKPISVRTAVELIRRPGKLTSRIEAVHTRERRSLAQAEKVELHVYSDRIWAQHAGRVDRLKAEQAAERAQQRDAHFAATRRVTLQMAKASLATDLQKGPANDHAGRAVEIKERMAEWRAKNAGKDLGREM